MSKWTREEKGLPRHWLLPSTPHRPRPKLFGRYSLGSHPIPAGLLLDHVFSIARAVADSLDRVFSSLGILLYSRWLGAIETQRDDVTRTSGRVEWDANVTLRHPFC